MHRNPRRLLASSCALAALGVPAGAVWARPAEMQMRPAPMVSHIAAPAPAPTPTLRPGILSSPPPSQPLFGPRKGIEPVMCADSLRCR